MPEKATRSGKTFSPYAVSTGEPLLAPAFFTTRESIMHAPLDDDTSDHEGTDGFEPSTYKTTDRSNAEENGALHLPALHPAPSASVPLTHNQKSNARKRKRRTAQRAAALAEAEAPVKACIQRHRTKAARLVVGAQLGVAKDLGDIPTAPCWTAKREQEQARRVYTVEHIRDVLGIQVIPWDARCCRPIVDRNGVILGVLGGKPEDLGWDASVSIPAAKLIEAARQELAVPPNLLDHRRGRFPAFAVGISHGGGQTRPSIRSNPGNGSTLARLVNEQPLQRISGFANSLFQAYAPRLHRYYTNTLAAISESEGLKPVFPRSAFAACTINFGPQTVSYPHRDWANLPWGWCAITALGSYNPTNGGHLILWDLNFAIEFPPGATIIIPSALVRHSNTAIAASETRYSFAQYSAGGLFRWVDNGFQTEQAWLSKAAPEDIRRREEDKKQRWARGLAMLSTVQEL